MCVRVSREAGSDPALVARFTQSIGLQKPPGLRTDVHQHGGLGVHEMGTVDRVLARLEPVQDEAENAIQREFFDDGVHFTRPAKVLRSASCGTHRRSWRSQIPLYT